MINIRGTLKELQEIRSAKEDNEIDLKNWLVKRGWHYGSSNPACLWLFDKKLKDGRRVICDAAIAVHFEEAGA